MTTRPSALPFVDAPTPETIPITPITRAQLEPWLERASQGRRAWVKSVGFKAERGEFCPLPGDGGAMERVLLGVLDLGDPWSYASLPRRLPRGLYAIEPDEGAALEPSAADDIALGWGLGTYEFHRYRGGPRPVSTLVWPTGCDRGRATRLLEGVFLGRDLINTPASDMGPEQLAAAARVLAGRHGATVTVIIGDDLLAQNFPTVHAVGRASARAPRLVDLRWGDERHPRVTLVGKGVCFDSGGLDLKNAGGMKLMKKDMGGAATILGLAHAVMDAELPVRLRVLLPAVENSVSGDAMRPLDVITTRKGLTVEVGNTDAEGRLILCDALAEADGEKPDLLIDMATLTGAARVALGTALPALFCTDDAVADAILSAGLEVRDPLWRMPLYTPYRKQLDSAVADLSNIGSGRFGGAIMAALFLKEFVRESPRWVHIDTMAWNVDNRPGRPHGGEPMALRALFCMLERRYASG
ncbi:MAG: leucyl aminopeptidase family protein [Myxococcales bacterium]|nr:leucyl aminopeptidase family protein [Myxococcales bacterium]